MMAPRTPGPRDLTYRDGDRVIPVNRPEPPEPPPRRDGTIELMRAQREHRLNYPEGVSIAERCVEVYGGHTPGPHDACARCHTPKGQW